MGKDVDGSHTHQNEEEEQNTRQPATTSAQGKEEENSGDTDMTARKGSSRPFTRIVRYVEEMVEETIGPARCCHSEVMR